MISEESIRNKWDEFVVIREKLDKQDPQYIKARNSLLEIYYPLVTKVAERMHKKIREVDIGDLVAWGTDGLFHAVERFDPSLKNKFETFAIHRIRGSILDNIRQVDWVPRLVRQRYSKIQKVKQTLESELGRMPTHEEIADHMGLSLDEYMEISAKATPVSCISMNAGRSEDSDTGEEIQIESITTDEEKPDTTVLREEMFKKLMGKNFIPLERKIVHMHYYDNMTMKEIAKETGYSESRISQMHSKIIERLQKKVELNPNYMKGLEVILQS